MIYCGDCLEIMPTLPDKSIDMILCDLPYGTTACKWDVVIPFEPLWKEYKRLIKDNGAIVLTASQPFTSSLVMSNPKLFKYEWIYEKTKATNYLNAKKNPMKYHENILVFGYGLLNYIPQMTKGEPYHRTHRNEKDESTYGKSTRKNGHILNNAGERYPSSVIRFKNPSGRGQLHPTQKPVALFEYLIRTYTNEGETVLDNCAGSGTTGVACVKTRREFILIEKDPKYVAMIERRIKQVQPPLPMTMEAHI